MTLDDISARDTGPDEARRLLETAFAQTRMAMCVTDPRRPDDPIVAVNRAFTELTGYRDDEIVGRNCRFLQGRDSDPAEVQRIRDCVAAGEVGFFEVLNYRKDGTPFWNALHIGPVRDADGTLIFHLGHQWDVTEKVETLRALEGRVRLGDSRLQGAIDETRRLRDAIDQAKDAMLLTEYAPLDEPGPRIVWASAGFERMTGYAREEVVGRTPRLLQGPATPRDELDRIRALLEGGTSVPLMRTINYKKDGTPFHLEWSIAPVGGENGAPRYWLSVQRDVTDQVEAQSKLELLAGELAHRNRNVVSVVMALQRMLPTEGRSAVEYQAALEERMRAMLRAQDAVLGQGGDGATVEALVRSVLAPFPDERILCEGEDVALDTAAATNMALALHELATNASKYGALSVAGGQVMLSWRRSGDQLEFDWIEAGGPPVKAPSRIGFGQALLNAVTLSASRPDSGYEYNPDGVRFRGGFALPAIAT